MTTTTQYRLARAAHYRRAREWRIRWAFFVAGIAFAALWVAL